jgi:integrase
VRWFTAVSRRWLQRQVVHLISGSTVDRMRGSIREYRHGYWLVRIDAGPDPISGKRRQASRTIRGSRRQAEELLDDLRVEVRTQSLPTAGLTLDELFENWIAATTRSGRARTASSVYHTRNRYRKYVQPRFGHLPIRSLRSSEITLLCDALMAQQGLSARTVGRVRSELRAMLGWAWRRDLVSENVAIKVDVPTVALRAPESLVVEELCAHLAHAATENPDLELIMLLVASLGLRRSEVAALRWSHIDFERQILRVREGLTATPGVGFQTTATKTGLHGFADFPLHRDLLERLHQRWEEFRERVDDVSPGPADGYVFSADLLSQRPLHPDSISGALAKHRKRHPELPYVSLQSLRRYSASDLYAEGDGQTVAAAVLRDTPETAARYYRAVNRQRARQAVLGIYERIDTQRDQMETENKVS